MTATNRAPARHNPRTFIVPAALLLAAFLPGLNSGFWRVDNPLYTAVSKYAWHTNTLWTLHAGDQLYFNKPPLAFWVHGLPLHIFGAELWAARLPMFFVALTALLFSVDAARRLAGSAPAIASGIVLALTLEFFRAMHSISLDLWLTAFITATAWCVVRATESDKVWRWGIAAGFCIGGGLMVKPMIALAALPFLAVWLVCIRQQRTLITIATAAIVGVLVALPWHISMALTHNELFLAEYFGSQIMDRVTTDAHGSEPWWKYIASLTGSYWPWLITLVLGALMLRNARLTKGERRAALLGIVFTLGWAAMLTVSHDKAGRYLIPVYPFASWVSGVWLARAFPASPKRDAWLNRAALAAPVVGALLLIVGVNPHGSIPPAWSELRTLIHANPDEQYCINPRSRTLGAQVYLMHDRWPSLAKWNEGAGETAGGNNPPAGALMLAKKRSPLYARPTDEVIFENNRFIVWRLTTDWTGDYAPNTEAPSSSVDDNADDE